MIVMNALDVIRDIAGAHRVQFTALRPGCSSAEASALDFQFRDQLYEGFDYRSFASEMIRLMPEDQVISCKDDFGLHYMVFRGRDTENGSYLILGPYVHHVVSGEELENLLKAHALPAEAMESLDWYFKRIPVIPDYLTWRSMLVSILSRYLANPNLQVLNVTYDHPEELRRKPAIAFSSIPYTSVEARYAVERAMLEAIRRGDISEATYQQNLFMGFTLDQRVEDRLRDAKDMIIAVNTAYRKAVEQAEVHPMYIDGISGRFVAEIEAATTPEQVQEVIPRMIRNYCLLVQTHSLARYSEGIRKCINYIDFHYMEPLNLDSLALRFSMNKNYLSSRFHKEVGFTVTDYINLSRSRRAVELLNRTPLPIQEIAEKCGFTDANYFTRTFKKINGITPNEYRKSTAQRKNRSPAAEPFRFPAHD